MTPRSGPVLAIHGGAGEPPTDEAARAAAERALAAALRAGWAVLAAGGAALDAVERAVAAMEQSGVFNAGRGAVADRNGGISLDATIMNGRTRAAGAVAGVTRVGNAIAAARLVMDRTSHVLLIGPAADELAIAGGVPEVARGYFIKPAAPSPGTVGAVGRDASGQLAAATSTGGIRGKLPGRVGDSAVVGAGTWADARCAVSATGTGELFIRAAFGHEVAAGMARSGLTLVDAVDAALADVTSLGGRGGCVAVDADGLVVMPFTTAVMYRGVVEGEDPPRVGTFAGELRPVGGETGETA